jgi:transposase
VPTRVRKPRDKAKVESGVLVVERWILAPLRHQQFFSLAELNQAIGERLQELNQRPFQKLPGSRQTLFESLDRPVLRALPAEPYEFAEWKKARVNLDYHIEVAGHYYSVPYRLLRQTVEVRLTTRTVESFYQGQRVSSHVRSFQQGGYTTLKEHMPKSHREYGEWTPERFLLRAEKIGPHTEILIRQILQNRPYPAQGFRSCLGILNLSKKFGEERLEKACQRALDIGALSYKSLRSILQTGLDRRPLPESSSASPPLEHANIRGSQYFH